jgi:hypothetical protein
MDSTDYMKNKDKDVMFVDNAEEIEEYSNLRTLASTLLEAFCRHIDSSLPEILAFSNSVLRNQTTS